MKSGSELGEYERIGVLVVRKRELLSAVARKGHAEHGGAQFSIVSCGKKTFPQATPFYLPASEPELANAGAEIQQAVAMYRPLSEGVVVVVTHQDEVYVARLELSSLEEKALGSRIH